MTRQLTDQDIRQWILADEALYLEARDFGNGNDQDMYEHIYEFIEKNRKRLTEYIRKRLGE